MNNIKAQNLILDKSNVSYFVKENLGKYLDVMPWYVPVTNNQYELIVQILEANKYIPEIFFKTQSTNYLFKFSDAVNYLSENILNKISNILDVKSTQEVDGLKRILLNKSHATQLIYPNIENALKSDMKLQANLETLLELPIGSLKLYGGSLYNPGPYLNDRAHDIDFILTDKNLIPKTINKIKEIVTIKEYEYIKYGGTHHRIFYFQNRLIDIYFENPEDMNFKVVNAETKQYIECKAKIIDISASGFYPALFLLDNGSYLVSYNLGHKLQFNIGEKINFKGYKALISLYDNTKEAIIFEPYRAWEDITAKKRFININRNKSNP